MEQRTKRRRGATTIEYAMIAAAIALTALGAFTSAGDATTQMWEQLQTTILSAFQP